MSEPMQLGIHFISPEIEQLYRKAGFQDDVSSGFDLMNVEEVTLSLANPFQLINLGVVIKPPEGYHSLLIPRSSTFKKYNILQANSIGLIDENFCGKEDLWRLPVVFYPQIAYKEDTGFIVKYDITETIPVGTRICQFFIQPKYRFTTYPYNPTFESRGGFGSTGQ